MSRQDGRGYGNFPDALGYDMNAMPPLNDPPSISSSATSSGESDNDADDEVISPPKKWPLYGIQDPGDHDCLNGRGGGTNHHPGNIKYRKFIDDRKATYKALNRSDKSLLSSQLVQKWRTQNPPGRFLKLNDETGLWDDIGDEEATKKVSQSLREKRTSKLAVETSMRINNNVVGETAARPEANRISLLFKEPSSLTTALHQSAIPASSTQSNKQRRNSTTSQRRVTIPVPSLSDGSYQPLQQAMLSKEVPSSNSSSEFAKQKNLSIISNSLLVIGIRDISLLKGTVDEEFQLIKKAYFDTVLRLHPARNPGGDHSVFQFARASFEVLRSMLHKLRAKRSSFVSFFSAAKDGKASDLEYISDLYSQCATLTWEGNYPSYQHTAMAACQKHPSICVEVSSDCCKQCTKCNHLIQLGDIQVGSFMGQEFGKWKHLKCWSVTADIWLGLTNLSDPCNALRDVKSMDEVILKGFRRLDEASQFEFVRHIMDRNRIALTGQPQLPGLSRTTPLISPGDSNGSTVGLEFPFLFNENEGLGQKRATHNDRI